MNGMPRIPMVRFLPSSLARLAWLVLALCAVLPPPAAGAQSSAGDTFDVPAGLERAVEFWKRVYGEWSQDQVTFHDRDDLGIVYLTIDQKKSEPPAGYRANEAAQEALIDRYRRILLDLATRNPDPRTLSGEYREVYGAFGELGNPARWRQAADRIRVQRGLREK